MRTGETIRLEASSRPHAESLQQAFPTYSSELVQEKGSWQVELQLGPESKLLLELFDTMQSWLVQEQLASMIVHFDSKAFTLLRPTNGDAPDSKEFLLHRVAQFERGTRLTDRDRTGKGHPRRTAPDHDRAGI